MGRSNQVDIVAANVLQIQHHVCQVLVSNLLDPAYRRSGLQLTLGEMISLRFGRVLFNFLEGTQFATDLNQAIDRLRKMFADDKSTEYTVVGAFAYHLRRMFNAKAMLQRGSPSSVVEKKLNIWSNKDAFFNQLRKISLSQIGQYLQQLAQTDYQIKTGRTKAQVAVEQLVLKLIAA